MTTFAPFRIGALLEKRFRALPLRRITTKVGFRLTASAATAVASSPLIMEHDTIYSLDITADAFM